MSCWHVIVVNSLQTPSEWYRQSRNDANFRFAILHVRAIDKENPLDDIYSYMVTGVTVQCVDGTDNDNMWMFGSWIRCHRVYFGFVCYGLAPAK